MPAKDPFVYIYMDPTLDGASRVMAKLTSQSLSSLVRRSVKEMLATNSVPHSYGLGPGERSTKARIYLPADLREQLLKAAEKHDVSISSLTTGALALYVTRMIDGSKPSLDSEVSLRKVVRGASTAANT